jgi:hypothetical protein
MGMRLQRASRGRPKRVTFDLASATTHTQRTGLNPLCRAGLYSDDDLGWLCCWGGDRVFAWEELELKMSDACVVDHVDFWLWKESEHLHVNHTRLGLDMPELQESEIPLLLKHVCTLRWRKQKRPF